MQKPARAYGMSKVEYQRRVQEFAAMQVRPVQSGDNILTRLFKSFS